MRGTVEFLNGKVSEGIHLICRWVSGPYTGTVKGPVLRMGKQVIQGFRGIELIDLFFRETALEMRVIRGIEIIGGTA